MEDTNIKHFQLRLPIGLYDRLRAAAAAKSGKSNPNLQEFCVWMIQDYLDAAEVAKNIEVTRADERALQAARRILQGGGEEIGDILRGVIKTIDTTVRERHSGHV